MTEATRMRAHRLKVHVDRDQALVVPLPGDVHEVDVEVIVLIPDQPETASSDTLASFNAWLREQPPTGRSKEEMDRAIADERASWE